MRRSGYRWPAEVILAAMRWYLRYPLSGRQVAELLAERGVDVSARTSRLPGRNVLMVEVSPFPGETFIDQWKRDRVRHKIAANVRSWDAIVAFSRWWDRAEPAQVYVLHLEEGADALLPALPGLRS